MQQVLPSIYNLKHETCTMPAIVKLLPVQHLILIIQHLLSIHGNFYFPDNHRARVVIIAHSLEYTFDF